MPFLVFANEHPWKQEGCVWVAAGRSKDCSSPVLREDFRWTQANWPVWGEAENV